MPRNTLDFSLSFAIFAPASMRPRRDAAEYLCIRWRPRSSNTASMRPRRDAAEYAPSRARHEGRWMLQ